MRIDQKSQSQEHDYLEQPCQSVHERIGFFPVSQSGISNNHSGDIYCQIAVSFNQVGKSKCDEDQTKQKNRVESTVGKFYFIDKPDSELTEGVSYDSSEQELYK